MKTQFTIKTAGELPDGSVLISGSVKGPFVTLETKGQQGVAVTSDGNIKVLLMGIGVTDPNFLTRERQGLLIKILEGSVDKLQGLTLDFGG